MKLKTVTKDKHTQLQIPLLIKPDHKTLPFINGKLFSKHSGIFFNGHYSMDYKLPKGDIIRLLANHNQKTVQILLITSDPQKLQFMPGIRTSSLIADLIARMHTYRLRSNSYLYHRSNFQLIKYQYASETILALQTLLEEERNIPCTDYYGQEGLRRKAISIIERCRDKNRLLANNPVISEGALGDILYDAKKAAEHYTFNRVHPVSRLDQLDYSQHPFKKKRSGKTSFVWDSELHIGHNEHHIANAIREICRIYRLNPATELNQVAANRFLRTGQFIQRLWNEAKDWADYLALNKKPFPKRHTSKKYKRLSLTNITPYYRLTGLEQTEYKSLESLVASLTQKKIPGGNANNVKNALLSLQKAENGYWIKLDNTYQVFVKINNQVVKINYFINKKKYIPLPDGQDLYGLCQLSKRHLYLPERAYLQAKTFISRIPAFFTTVYSSIKTYINHDLYKEFIDYIHDGKNRLPPTSKNKKKLGLRKKIICRGHSLKDVLRNKGYLQNNQTLKEFIHTHLKHTFIVRPQHPNMPMYYTNPFHRIVLLFRHLAVFFIEPNERNPILGSLALAAYAYGAGAVVAPEQLKNLLTKLQLKGLIYGIEPTQKLGKWMSHGTLSEATSAAVTYWQGIIVGGEMDQFFVNAIDALKENPAEIAIILSLAMFLGYELCEKIPTLKEEMGSFPYTNYLAVGGKGGAAIYDTIMYPGDDWLIGTMKWILKNIMITSKIIFGPFFKAYFYGFKQGFLKGIGKSIHLLFKSAQQMLTVVLDLAILMLTVPLIEFSILFLKIPYRGLTGLLSKTLYLCGSLKPIGTSLLFFSESVRNKDFFKSFRLSPLYGFFSPFAHFSDKTPINILMNSIMLFLSPPVQIIKNLFLLPVLDLTSIMVRTVLATTAPVVWLSALSIGTFLNKTGSLWDHTIGIIFTAMGTGVTKTTNKGEQIAGSLRQWLLSRLHIFRKTIYHSAFFEDEKKSAYILKNEDYFQKKPERIERIPHKPKNCLLENTLKSNKKNHTIHNLFHKRSEGDLGKDVNKQLRQRTI